MNPSELPPIGLTENDDWQVTRVIYTDEIVCENDTDVTLHIPISLGNTIAIRILPLVELCDNPSSSSTRSSSDDGDGASEDDSPAEEYDEFKVNPHFQYLVLSQIDDPPIIKVSFHYPSTENDSCPDSLSISLLQYPNLWPAAEKDKWTEWISTKANDILQDTNMSSAVCDFLLHKVIGYFEAVDENSMHGYSAILFQSVGYHDEAWKLVNADKSRVVKDIRVKKKLPYDTPLIHKYARQALKRNWKRYIEYVCPICFSTEICEEAVELPCDHLYCRECISMYVKTIIADILMHRVDPFICPIPTCKEHMNVLGSPGKIMRTCSCDVLSEEQKEQVLQWKKDIEYPLCHVLTMCPRPKCKARGMRKVNNSTTNTLVSCEECSAIFCDLCLKRIYANQVGFDHLANCDETNVLRLVKRYLRASPELQSNCSEKLHWIEEYASVREIDASLKLWVQENANTCPTCKNAIERIEGCFHIHCTECGTHFCYECGEEIFFPFYGTHHCWERPVFDEDFGGGLFD